MRNLKHLEPSQVVLDKVLSWSNGIGQPETATIKQTDLLITSRNHRGQGVMLSVPIHFDGESDDEAPRFVLRRLGPNVWKLAPSVLSPMLHAYITVVNVPEPPPWETEGTTT